VSETPVLLAGAALAVATTTGTALFLTHNRAEKRLVRGGDLPRELFGVLHGSLLSGVKSLQCEEHPRTYFDSMGDVSIIVKYKILQNHFPPRTVRVSKPRHTARILGGRNRAEISLSFLEFFSGGARKRKIVRENFYEVLAVAITEADGGPRAYDSILSHHALRACKVRDLSVRNGFAQSV